MENEPRTTTSLADSTGNDTSKPTDIGKLRNELMTLFGHLQLLRTELAAIKHPGDNDMGFSRTGSQLEAVVAATESATDTIMEATERNEEIVDKLRNDDKGHDALLDNILENGYQIMEACSFQDITGQRVGKVAKFVDHIEDRIDALINIWGKDDIDRLGTLIADQRSEDEKLLSGPTLADEGVGQDDIDKLFG